MIRLYHGSNTVIEHIDLSRSKRGKDFGQGFYLNANPDQAMEMAIRTARFMNEGQPTLSCFEFDETKADEMGLSIKVFPDYSEEWAEFVVMNRKNDSDIPAHSYDIVIGPIADDTVGVQIRRYIMGYLSVATLVEELKFKGDHAFQYFFGTPRSRRISKTHRTMTQDIQFQIECLATELTEMLMAEYDWDIRHALDELYSSTTFAKLNDPECGLYYQGAVYIFQFLKSEIETGKIA